MTGSSTLQKSFDILEVSPGRIGDKSLKDGIMLQVSLLMALGALLWTFLVVSLGLPNQTIIPLVYIAITTTNIFLCQNKEWKNVGCNIQILTSILLPSIFQIMMGGLISSGMVMQWSVVAMGGVLTFDRGKRLYLWLALTLSSMALAILADPLAQEYFSNPVKIHSKWFFLLNTILCSASLFIIGMYFLNNISTAKKELAEANKQLQFTLTDLTAKNTELLEGMRYAEHIQNTIFPTHEYLTSVFPKSFRIHRPKDHVSGDFLWVMEVGKWKVAACVDCTGHGIPGGLLGMLAYCILNELVYEKKCEDPAELLRAMNRVVVKRLNQRSNSNKDGMEISMVFFDPESGRLKMASAGGSIFILRANDSSVERYRINRRHIGGQVSNGDLAFESCEIALDEGDRVYLVTDGYADQFGGELGKKYSRKRLRKMLKAVSSERITDQGELFLKEFQEWKGSNPQTDDVLLLGFER